MFVYANLLGTWTERTEDDSIDGCSPQKFIENILLSENSYEDFKSSNEFVEVVINKDAYHIHKSCIQYTYKK